jgi:hypothetical protein
MEYIGYDRALYNALCSKGEEIGWTTRDITTSQALTNSEGVKGEPAINMEQFDTDQSAAPMLSDEDSDRLEEESKIMIGPEDLKQMMTKESPPSKNARV